MTVQELQQLKLKVERAKSEFDMAMGRLQSAMSSIEAMGFSSIKELQAKIEQLTGEIASKTAELDQACADWKEKYASLL